MRPSNVGLPKRGETKTLAKKTKAWTKRRFNRKDVCKRLTKPLRKVTARGCGLEEEPFILFGTDWDRHLAAEGLAMTVVAADLFYFVFVV